MLRSWSVGLDSLTDLLVERFFSRYSRMMPRRISVGFSGTPNNGTPWAPSYSHTTPIKIPKDMGIVWEAYHKGVPLLGVPGITLEMGSRKKKHQTSLR